MTRHFPLTATLILLGSAAACTPVAEQPQSRHRQMYGLIQKFDRFDENGDGYLTRGELATGIKESGAPHLTPAQLDQVMKGYDRNGDQRISQREAQQGADSGPEVFGPQ